MTLLDKKAVETYLRPYFDEKQGKFVDNDGNTYDSAKDAVKQAQVVDYLTEKKDYSPYIITNNGTKIQTENEYRNSLEKDAQFNALKNQEVKRIQKAKGGIIRDRGKPFSIYKKGGPVKTKKKPEPDYKFKFQKADLELPLKPELLKKDFEDLKKKGLIAPDTTFERFEKIINDQINDILTDEISLRDRTPLDDIILQTGLRKLDQADSGISAIYGKKKFQGDDLLSKIDRAVYMANAAKSLDENENKQIDLFRRKIINGTKQELRPSFSSGGLGKLRFSKENLVGFLKSEFPRDYIRMEDKIKTMSPEDLEETLNYLRDVNRKNFAAGGNGSIPKMSRKEFLRLPFKQRINLMYGLDLTGQEKVSDILKQIKSMPTKLDIE